MPASGAEGSTTAPLPPLLAGINPAPHQERAVACGAGFMPASGAEGSTNAALPPLLAGINPAPHQARGGLWGRLHARPRGGRRADAARGTLGCRDEAGP